MKIIVSSKQLKRSLKSIFNFYNFKTILKHDCLEFYNEEQDEIIRCYGETKNVTQDSELEYYLKDWIKLYNISKELDEQPLVLTFDGSITISGIMI